MLWRTLFSVIVELGIRSGLFTAEELTPSMGGAPPGRGAVLTEDHWQEEHGSDLQAVRTLVRSLERSQLGRMIP